MDNSVCPEEEPLHLNRIISSLMESVSPALLEGDPSGLVIEQFQSKRKTYWRAFFRIGSKLVNSSTRDHVSPIDALRELTERQSPS